MQSRVEIFKFFIKEANQNKDDFSYSSIMRRIRKQYPNKVHDFMNAFKAAFDSIQDQNIEGSEQVALMQAIKLVGLE